MNKKLFTIIILLLLAAAILLAWKRMPMLGNTPVAVAKCGMTVSSPTPNQVVSFPFSVQAVVDNTQRTTLGCSWTVFEAQSGVAELIDATNTVYKTVPLATAQDWMTDSAVNYSATFATLPAGLPQTFSLRITEEDPAAMGNADVITIPLSR